MNVKRPEIRSSMRVVLALVLPFETSCSANDAGSPLDFQSGAGGSVLPGTGGTPAVAGAGTGGDNLTFVPPSMVPSSCGSAAYESQLLPSSILVVMDRSLTMTCNPPPATASADCEAAPRTADTAQPTKWSILGNALSSALDTLKTVPNASLGLTLFSNDDQCGVQSAPNVGVQGLSQPQVDALRNGLNQVKPGGATPMVGATVLAYRHLHQVAQAPGNRFVVLFTDGIDNCGQYYAEQGVQGDPFQILDGEIAKAVTVNIRTFVIGTPGSSGARGALSRMAHLGGTPRDPNCDHTSADPAPGTECHVDMTRTTDFAKDLSEALGRITSTTALKCEFDVPKPTDGSAIDVNKINVDYYRAGDMTNPASKVELFRDDTLPCDAGANGWQYASDSGKIRICGGPCDEARGDAAARVVVSTCGEQRIIR